ncbi:MAG: hypothetical protein QCI82_07965, partial [Candidatus Thermoplasmatota archaeon]|nr:hypothetical protein [Candidatus Thermoplasmatota archaeon]
MNDRVRETILVSVAAVLFLATFMAIAYFDRSHGDVGTEYGVDQVDVAISGSQGKITVPDLPEDLIFIGASQPASMDLSVTNNDPDNDIDTIYVTIPGSTITGTGYEWYVPSEPRDWNMSLPQSDVAMFQAVTDYPGLNYGGSAQ